MNVETNQNVVATMFTEMVDYAALREREEPLAVDLHQEHLDLVRDALLMFGGREVKVADDSVTIGFSDALAAVHCAIEVQRTLAERNEKKSEERQILSRVGIHLGAVDRRENGDASETIEIASRVARLAEPGGICLSGAAFDLGQGKVAHPLVPIERREQDQLPAGLTVYSLEYQTPASPALVRAAQRKLFWMVVGILVLNVILFLKFGLQRSGPAPSGTNAAPNAARTNTIENPNASPDRNTAR